MNWVDVTVHDLRTYYEKRLSIINMKEEIADLESYIKSGLGNTTVVQSGCNNDKILNSIVKKDRLLNNLRHTENIVERIERSLSILAPDEYKIIQYRFIDKKDNAIDMLCHELEYERSIIYKKSNEILKKITRCMYGIIEI